MNEKEFWHEIAEKEAAIASKLIKRMVWLKPGTYRALDIHKAIQKICGTKYYLYDYAAKLSKGKEFEIHDAEGYFKRPLSNVFYDLHRAEILAGESRRKARRWTVPNAGKLITETSFVMPAQKSMVKLPCLLKALAGKDARLTFELQKEVMTLNEGQKGRYTLNLSAYDRSRVPCGTVYISLDKLRHLYGKCTLKFYFDPMSESTSLMVTNPDGWTTGLSCEVTKDSNSFAV